MLSHACFVAFSVLLQLNIEGVVHQCVLVAVNYVVHLIILANCVYQLFGIHIFKYVIRMSPMSELMLHS